MLATLVLTLVVAADTLAPRVRVAPVVPWIEQDPSGAGAPQYLNFDFLIEGHPTEQRTLAKVELAVHDRAGRLVQWRFCDGSGISPCIATLPDRIVPARADAILYNPFPEFSSGVELAELRYRLFFANDAGALVDTVAVAVRPIPPTTTPAAVLPLRGRVVVWDGHDALSHHRRWNLAHPVIRAVGFTGNSGRYAYDLSLVDDSGAMYRGSGRQNEEWYSWDAVVRAPANGRVVAVANDEPDHRIDGPGLPDSVIFARPIALYGNYVVIDHGEGAYSMLAHLRQGSIRVRPGEEVRPGTPLGRVGFSGSVKTIHVHYQMQAGPEYFAEGRPSYFMGVRRVGSTAPWETVRRIDSGDIVEAR